MKSRKILGLCVGAITFAAIIIFVSRPRGQTEACIEASSCLSSYNNSGVCETLPVGVSRKELFVRLGQPTRISGTTLYFSPGALESYEIVVVLDAQDNAIELRCLGPNSEK
jgi:hypothetical protein